MAAQSSAEAEYCAMAKSVTEILWFKKLLDELGFQVNIPVKLCCDSQAALHIATNPVFHEHTKHIEIDCYFIREKFQDGTVSLHQISSKVQIADLLTKALPSTRHRELQSKLSLVDS